MLATLEEERSDVIEAPPLVCHVPVEMPPRKAPGPNVDVIAKTIVKTKSPTPNLDAHVLVMSNIVQAPLAHGCNPKTNSSTPLHPEHQTSIDIALKKCTPSTTCTVRHLSKNGDNVYTFHNKARTKLRDDDKVIIHVPTSLTVISVRGDVSRLWET